MDFNLKILAVSPGLILNEAITNAIKYACKPDEADTIYISLVSKGNGKYLTGL